MPPHTQSANPAFWQVRMVQEGCIKPLLQMLPHPDAAIQVPETRFPKPESFEIEMVKHLCSNFRQKPEILGHPGTRNPIPETRILEQHIRSPSLLDHIPLYSPVYGGVEGKALGSSCMPRALCGGTPTWPSRYPKPDTRNSMPDARNPIPKTGCLKSDTRNPISDTRKPTPVIRILHSVGSKASLLYILLPDARDPETRNPLAGA